MNWSEAISRAIEYIEDNLTKDITVEEISNYVYISPFYFQKGFAIACGYSLSEYIRNIDKSFNELNEKQVKIKQIILF